jgi:hypothetical protein
MIAAMPEGCVPTGAAVCVPPWPVFWVPPAGGCCPEGGLVAPGWFAGGVCALTPAAIVPTSAVATSRLLDSLKRLEMPPHP